ncbi:hypothetical protein [Sinobaca sp. H24]|uniref:hypothetical protein n=1 Tax=Sinobaca sp. H24 TaxID=2923376 RepID=UPI00207A0B7D|nr:hypothetical protein [Sinobaca sp. H24]
MNTYLALAESVRMINKGTHSILIDYDDTLEFIGKGRSAYVFKIEETEVVLKVFFPDFAAVAKEEALIYQALGGWNITRTYMKQEKIIWSSTT